MKRLSANTPLRVQLVAVAVLLAAVALLITSLASTSILRSYLLNRVDNQLQATARGQLDHPGGQRGPGLPRDEAGGPALSSAFFVMVVDELGNGKAQLRTPSGIEQSGPNLPDLSLKQLDAVGAKPFTVKPRSSGYDWRVVVTPLPSDAGAIVVGSTVNDVESTVARLRAVNVTTGLVVLVLIGAVGFGLVTSRLRRLVEVEETTERIAAGDLTQRVPNANDKTEVGRLALAVNTMLGRIEQSFTAQQSSEEEARASEQRMRRFVADASHELRTPLTSIRGFAELHRQGNAVGAPLPAHLMSRIESEATRMGVLVEDLLLLARLDQQRPLIEEHVDVCALVQDVLKDAPAVAPGHQLRVHIAENPSDQTDDWIVTGDELRLRQVVTNLMNNVYTHTPVGTSVDVSLNRNADSIILVVADDGPGMSEEDSARVFERFYRSDPSRTRASGGSGLGLSIVQGIVAAHGGSIALATSPDGGATFTVTLPRSRNEREESSTS